MSDSQATPAAQDGGPEEQARRLAGQYAVLNGRARPGQDSLLNRPAELEDLVHSAYQHFRQAAAAQLGLPYAAEWVLDNYYVLQQAIRLIREDLPRRYYAELPKLAGPRLQGLPRVYALARDLLSPRDGTSPGGTKSLGETQVDIEEVACFLEAFQQVSPLTMGEIWAVPIMLRLVAVEMLAEAVARLASLAPAAGTEKESQASRATDEATVANAVLSLRAMSAYDWKELFERVSLVEQTLGKDPAGLYRRLDFETRDRYRKVIEDIAHDAGCAELDAARTAVDLAAAEAARLGVSLPDNEPWAGLHTAREAHIGYNLVDAGRPLLEEKLGVRLPWPRRLGRWLLVHATPTYLAGIALLALVVEVAAIAYAWAAGRSPWLALAAAILALVPALTVAVDGVNWLVGMLVRPRVLPKLDFEDGIAPGCQAMVVMPALLASLGDVDALLGRLEQHYLTNLDPNLSFALLTDFADAPQQEMPEDKELLAAAEARVKALNDRYGGPDGRPFYFFHRRRLWNPSEGVWMAWERKRGKLHEFNRLLLGEGQTSYSVQIGDLARLSHIRYVITLDADTSLPWESGWRLVGALAHPLNRPVLDATGRVAAGYTLLQPRVEIRPTSANRSLFTRIYAGDTGLDLYTRAVSNVYQDLFGEGIFVGKGIYDVAAFERSLAGRVPENTLLSHDLFEGIHGRAGLVTDIVLYEDYPPHYLAEIRRTERWIRGDWQLLPWLMPRVPRAGGGTQPNRLSVLDRWKIADNLRRSLLAPALLALLVAGWLFLPGSPLAWTLAALLALAVPLITSTSAGLLASARQRSLGALGSGPRLAAMRWLLALVFLPFEALQALDAVAVTLVRMAITRRHLLQWTTAAHTARLFGVESGPVVTWRQMAQALALAAGLGVLVGLVRPAALPPALPLIVAWLISPQIAYWISRPLALEEPRLPADQLVTLRRLARRTWLFFERFVGPDDQWLPPDHFQESPKGVVAHHTSPTNVGLLLLSTLGAFDLGYVGLMGMALRLRDTFETLGRLEKHRGHLLNWYNTQNLAPLPPRYVSTVDSGNLAACLLALRQGCLELAGRPVLRWERWLGLLDTIELLAEGLPAVDDAAVRSVREHLAGLRDQVVAAAGTPGEWPALLRAIGGGGWQSLDAGLTELVESGAAGLDVPTLRSLRVLAERVQHHLVSMQREYDLLLPWLSVGRDQPPWPGHPALAAEWQALLGALPPAANLGDIPAAAREAQARLSGLQAHLDTPANSDATAARAWCERLRQALDTARMSAGSLLAAYQDIATQAEAMVQGMDFCFLFDARREVFHIGFNVDSGQLDRNYYDLLASEARIASLVAVAKGEVSADHWLHLARPLTQVEGMRVLLSWSGTMFEYLMPRLFLPDYPGTFLAQSSRAAVRRQIAYARQKGVPWGISESGYYHFDADLNYQYRAFGVPGLGFKRGLSEDLVIAPYASLLALPLEPQAVVDNLKRLDALHMLGRFGYYESVDFTQARLDIGQKYAPVRSYMAHHQGMVLVSIVNYLADDSMIKRLGRDPRMRSTSLLLQERVPPATQASVEYPSPEEAGSRLPIQPTPPLEPWRVPADGPMPRVHHMSNGRYSVLVTSGGGGFSRWQDIDLTRWRADPTLDDWGTWIYVQDMDAGALWSVTSQPAGKASAVPDVLYYPHKAEFRHQLDGGSLATLLEVAVAPDDDVEIRRVTLTNRSGRPRRLRLTSYAEIVLAGQATDRRHPAFNKMFIESEYLPDLNALLFRRRPRSADDKPIFLAHWLISHADRPPGGAFETDRARFLGRGRTVHDPLALAGNREPALSGTIGATLDPILALAQDVELEPYGTQHITFFVAVAGSRDELLNLAARYRSPAPIDRALDQARAASERELYALGLDAPALERIEQLHSALLYPTNRLRADRATLAANTKGQPGLWAYSISGDYPIVLVRIDAEDHLSLVRELLQAHVYWRHRQVQVDLVILNQRDTGYAQELQEQIGRAIDATDGQAWLNRRGGIFLLSGPHVPEADRVLLATAARAVLDGARGSLAEQLRGLDDRPVRLPAFVPTLSQAGEVETTASIARPEGLLFDNGRGGFSADGREYVIYLDPGRVPGPPAPWINVIANPRAGTIVSEAGAGYSWTENSGENRLSPWANDPVSDRPGEAIYLRDEETGAVWSPTPLPAGAPTPTVVRHGAGYTTFEHHSHGLKQRVRLFLGPADPVKFVQLRLENTWPRIRRITATYYVEWVLGTTHEETMAYILPEYYSAGNALLARNPYNTEFGDRVAFAAASQPLHGLTADRTEFLGRMGSLASPAALMRIGPANAVDPGLDPCAAIQIHVNLQPGEAVDVHFFVGQGQDRDEALGLIERYRDAGRVEAAWHAANEMWDGLLGTVTVRTPEPEMDVLLNRWLLYQALSCRIWGRSALYQSSGAFGFRDQLQDVMALVFAAPHLIREHILRAARYQFEAGDVLHWWHPPSGRGIRSRCSDDLLWLPFVTAHYIGATGDRSILDEQVPFLKGPQLEPGQDERYGQYEPAAQPSTLREHCRRAILRGTTAGAHGLPLIGSGDWNDGYNHVGADGRGESTWVAWFLYTILGAFATLEEEMGDERQAAAYRQKAAELRQAIHDQAWDGEWYIRAFYDDGRPLGSARSRECQIDSIAQSWAVLSGGADPARAEQAMQSVDERLVREDEGLILLFAPPFDQTLRDPGYIKAYVPGIRENGGQYTHAALWAVWAMTELGQGDRAAAWFRLLNPITHAARPHDLERYQVEPYVVAADVYSVSPHVGRGGWTWYTGSAAWMYRLGVEAILGLSREGEALLVAPCIPSEWPGYEMTVRHGRARYHIVIANPDRVERGVQQILLDGQELVDPRIPLRDDGQTHEVRVRMGRADPGRGSGRDTTGPRFVPLLNVAEEKRSK